MDIDKDGTPSKNHGAQSQVRKRSSSKSSLKHGGGDPFTASVEELDEMSKQLLH